MVDQIVAIGSPVPAVVLPRLEGGELQLAELRGTKHVLYMWASW
jgi:peroxiredoxin